MNIYLWSKASKMRRIENVVGLFDVHLRSCFRFAKQCTQYAEGTGGSDELLYCAYVTLCPVGFTLFHSCGGFIKAKRRCYWLFNLKQSNTLFNNVYQAHKYLILFTSTKLVLNRFLDCGFGTLCLICWQVTPVVSYLLY